MANNKKISQLGLAGGLTGAELVPVVKAGVTVQTTTQDIADLSTSGVQSVSGTNVDNTDPLNPIVEDELTASNFGDFTTGLASKATPSTSDSMILSDALAAGVAKKTTILQIRTIFKTYFDAIYTTTADVATQITTALSGYLALSGGALTGLLKQAKSTDIASAGTTDLSTVNGNLVHITGTTTITSFGTVQSGATIKVIFDGALTLTHNATSLILPGASNIVTAAGDSALLVSEGSGNWKCMFYQSAASTIGTWSPSWTGFSANPTTNYAEYQLIGDVCTVWLNANNGTSNATTCTVTLPFASKYGGIRTIQNVLNNSLPTSGVLITSAASNILTGYATPATGAWTNSGGKNIYLGGFSYRIA